MSFNFLMYLRLLYLMYNTEIKLHVLKLLPSLSIVLDRVQRPIPWSQDQSLEIRHNVLSEHASRTETRPHTLCTVHVASNGSLTSLCISQKWFEHWSANVSACTFRSAVKTAPPPCYNIARHRCLYPFITRKIKHGMGWLRLYNMIHPKLWMVALY